MNFENQRAIFYDDAAARPRRDETRYAQFPAGCQKILNGLRIGLPRMQIDTAKVSCAVITASRDFVASYSVRLRAVSVLFSRDGWSAAVLRAGSRSTLPQILF